MLIRRRLPAAHTQVLPSSYSPPACSTLGGHTCRCVPHRKPAPSGNSKRAVGAGIGTDQSLTMVSKKEQTNNLGQELHALIEGLREEVQGLRDEVQALRRREAPDGPEALLSREEAAERLRISTRTLDDMADAGEIQPVRIRGRVLYHPETLEAYIRARAGEGRS